MNIELDCGILRPFSDYAQKQLDARHNLQNGLKILHLKDPNHSIKDWKNYAKNSRPCVKL